jgi:hypothetical protein
LAIVHKWADGGGTYTPPGHWNDIAAELIANARWSEVRMARAFALLNMAMHDAGVGCWETKYFYFNPRPSQLDRSIKVKTGLPNFPSFTSGHSTLETVNGSTTLPRKPRSLDCMARCTTDQIVKWGWRMVEE